jgi:diguanylate cyclase
MMSLFENTSFLKELTMLPEVPLSQVFSSILVSATLVLGIALRQSLSENTRLSAAHQKRIEVLSKLSITDYLTGLTNRRGFEEQLRLLFQDERRSHANINALIVADLDRFKEINDRYGHQVGDAALQAMAEVLRSNTREDDIVTRYGGDEFLLVVALKDENSLGILMEKLRLAIATIKISLPGGSSTGITSSLGAYIFNATDLPSQEEAIRAADTALYRSKDEGGNSCWLLTTQQELVRLTPQRT